MGNRQADRPPLPTSGQAVSGMVTGSAGALVWIATPSGMVLARPGESLAVGTRVRVVDGVASPAARAGKVVAV